MPAEAGRGVVLRALFRSGRVALGTCFAVVLLLFLIAGAVHVSLCRQVESGEAASDRDVESQRRLPLVSRRPLRGGAAAGEVQALLVARWGTAVAALTSAESLAINSATRALAQGTLPPGLDAGLAAARRRLAPAIAAARDAIQAEALDPSFDADEWLKGAGAIKRLDLAGPGFMVAELEALEAGKNDEAAPLATDHLRFLDDLARWRSHDVGLSYRWGSWARAPGLVLAQAFPELDDAALAAARAELDVLAATRPDPWSVVRRLRVAFQRYHTRLRRRDLASYEDGLPPYWIPIAGPMLRRGVHLWFESVAAVEDETRGAPASTLRARLAGLGVVELSGRDYADDLRRALDVAFEDTARVLVARALAIAERFRRDHGRPPRSLEEALGRRPGQDEEDPFDGKPLRFAVVGDGVRVHSVGADEQDDGGSPRTNAFGRETDVVLELGARAVRRAGEPDTRTIPSAPRVR